MVRVHRSGKKFDFLPSNKTTTTTSRRRRLSKDAAHVISRGAVKHQPSQSRAANSVTQNKTEGPVTVIQVPTLVYIKIKDALKTIKSLGTNPTDKEDQFNLELAIKRVHIAASFYPDQLPRDWKFDPATASTILWQKMPFIEEKSDDRYHQKVQPPKIYRVSLNKDQSELWLNFKKSDEKTPTIHGLSLGRLKETAKPINVKHPFVLFIGAFAVDGYNKAFETYVKKGKHNYLEQYEVTECGYHKMSPEYWFHMTIEATEDGISGVYESKVQILTDDGRITLCRFIRIDQILEGKETMEMTSSKTHQEDGWSDPEKYDHSGLVCRTFHKGYDFYNPFGMDRHWNI